MRTRALWLSLALVSPLGAQVDARPEQVALVSPGDRERVDLVDSRSGRPIRQARWTSRAPAVAAVQQASGWITAIADGQTWVVGSAAEGSDSVRVTVGQVSPPPGPVLALDSARINLMGHPDPDSVRIAVAWSGTVSQVTIDLRADSGSAAGVSPGFPSSGSRWRLYAGPSSQTSMPVITVHRGMGFWVGALVSADTFAVHTDVMEVRRAALRAVVLFHSWVEPPDSTVAVADTTWYRVAGTWRKVYGPGGHAQIEIPSGASFCTEARGVTFRGDTIPVPDAEWVIADPAVLSMVDGDPCDPALQFWPR